MTSFDDWYKTKDFSLCYDKQNLIRFDECSLKDYLREATRSENKCNSFMYKNNTSGYKGVYWQKSAQKWHARIWSNNKLEYLGLFDSPEEAYAAYCKAAEELHGEFAKL